MSTVTHEHLDEVVTRRLRRAAYRAADAGAQSVADDLLDLLETYRESRAAAVDRDIKPGEEDRSQPPPGWERYGYRPDGMVRRTEYVLTLVDAWADHDSLIAPYREQSAQAEALLRDVERERDEARAWKAAAADAERRATESRAEARDAAEAAELLVVAAREEGRLDGRTAVCREIESGLVMLGLRPGSSEPLDLVGAVARALGERREGRAIGLRDAAAFHALTRVVDNGDGPAGGLEVRLSYDDETATYHARVDAGEVAASAEAPTLAIACLALGRCAEGVHVRVDAAGVLVCEECEGKGCDECDAGIPEKYGWEHGESVLPAAAPQGPRYVTAAEIERDHDNARALADAARDYSEAFEDADGEEEEAPVRAAFSALLDAARRWMAPAVAAHQGPEPDEGPSLEPDHVTRLCAAVVRGAWELPDDDGELCTTLAVRARQQWDACRAALRAAGLPLSGGGVKARAAAASQGGDAGPSQRAQRPVTLTHALALARVAMVFGKVERATLHPDGSPESDATHTVMLALLVADVARREGLDPGLAVQFAVVHDVPETYAGDTCTARGLSPDAAAEKAAREAASLERLRAELGPCWTTDMVDRYEAQREPEARLVRYLDKVLPKLTHILNGGLSLAAIDMTAEELERNHASQAAKLRAMYPGMTATRALFSDACALALYTMQQREDANPARGNAMPSS